MDTLKILQLSDLHLTTYRNLLEPLIDSINSESVDFVVVTGDVVHKKDFELFRLVEEWLNKIEHKVIVIPGDYDFCEEWTNTFGKEYRSLDINSYCIEFVNTSFMKHCYATGWGSEIKYRDIEQYKWLKDRISINKYHIIFSHHPMVLNLQGCELLNDNLRAVFFGHLHEPFRIFFEYKEPKSIFTKGFCSVPMKFHGNSCYSLILAKENGEITSIPKYVKVKKTAW